MLSVAAIPDRHRPWRGRRRGGRAGGGAADRDADIGAAAPLLVSLELHSGRLQIDCSCKPEERKRFHLQAWSFHVPAGWISTQSSPGPLSFGSPRFQLEKSARVPSAHTIRPSIIRSFSLITPPDQRVFMYSMAIRMAVDGRCASRHPRDAPDPTALGRRVPDELTDLVAVGLAVNFG